MYFKKGQKTWVVLAPSPRGESLQVVDAPSSTEETARLKAEALLAHSGCRYTRLYIAEVYEKVELASPPIKRTRLRQM